MNNSISGFPVKDLPARYNIGRTILYERINALGLKLEKVSNRAYVDDEGLKLLDELDRHIEKGGFTSEFLREYGVANEQSGQIAKNNAGKDFEDSEQSSIQLMLAAITSKLVDPLQELKGEQERLRMLSEITEQGWLIPTSYLLELLQLNSVPKLNDSIFERRGFRFVAMPRKGREREWQIRRQADVSNK